MIRIKTSDGKVFEGETARDVVRALGTTEDAPDTDVTRTMWRMAQRAKTYTGKAVSVETPEDFLRGLIAADLITLTEGTI